MTIKFLKRSFSEELVREFPELVLLERKFNSFLIGITDDRRGVYNENDLMSYFMTAAINKFSQDADMDDEDIYSEALTVFYCYMIDISNYFPENPPIICRNTDLLASFDALEDNVWCEFYHQSFLDYISSPDRKCK